MKTLILAAAVAVSLAACGSHTSAPTTRAASSVASAPAAVAVDSCASKRHDDSCHWIAHVDYADGTELQASDIACKDLLSASQFIAFKWKDAAADPSAVAVLMRNKDGYGVAAGCMIKSSAVPTMRQITWLKGGGLPGAVAESDIQPGATHFDQNGHDAGNGLDGALYDTSDVAGTLDDPTNQTHHGDEARKTIADALARKDLRWYSISLDPGANAGSVRVACGTPISDIPADLAVKPSRYHASEASKLGDNDYMIMYAAPQQGARLMYLANKATCQQFADNLRANTGDQSIAASTPEGSASVPAINSTKNTPTYADRVLRIVRPKIVWSSGTSDLATAIAVRCAPTGTLLSAIVVRSSGNSQWDAVALRAVQQTDPMPLDANGHVPAMFTISMRPPG